jgi:putative peptide zinc metalloprotease protein
VAITNPTTTETAERPLERADGLELIGEFQHSGFVEPPSIVRLSSGQTVQLTELLYVVLTCIDGQRDLDAIAAAVSEKIGKTASADNVRFLAEEKLRPLGLLKQPDGSNPEVAKPDPLLGIKGRFTLLNEERTQRLTAPFQFLFAPPIVVAVLATFVAVVGWLFFGEGLGAATRQLIYSPGMLLLVFGLTIASAGFHEFGHAAACRYGGARPGVIGGGIYLVWPAFYTDVTDAYRLSRAGRLRTDLGGLYFNIIFSLATAGVWAVTKYDPLLVLIPLQLFQMMHQLMPFIRADGYHILSDLTGVPDLFARVRPTIVSAIPGREPHERAQVLKRWVRVVVTIWVLAVVPVLLFSLTLAVVGLPRLLATVASSMAKQWTFMSHALRNTDVIQVALSLLSMFAVALPAASILYILSRMVVRTSRKAWSGTEGRPALRVLLFPAAALIVAGLAWLWWPNGEYRPLHRGERWTVQATVSHARHIATGRPGLTVGRQRSLQQQGDNPVTTTVVSTTTTTVERDERPTSTTTRARSGTSPGTPTPTTTAQPESPTSTAPTETTTP